MNHEKHLHCSDCDNQDWNRRDFVKTVGAAALAAGFAPLASISRSAYAGPKSEAPAETAVQQLYATLTEEQKKTICFPFDHELRTRISANWHITKPNIGDKFYTTEQQKLITDIVKNVTSEEGYERLLKQMDDDYGGMDQYSIALFGEPGSGRFQWEMTGRHLTLRADGDRNDNVAFGGPVVYGHGESNPAKNLFHYQTKKANEVFNALDEKQKQAALLEKAPRESQVPIQGEKGQFPGISVGELSSDQQALVEAVIKVILAPYRTEDVNEALAVLKQGGDLKSLHLAFYKEGDLHSDQVWDIWRVEGPSFVWHFRGAPHVHTYVNIGVKA